jgi:hypothetical protein
MFCPKCGVKIPDDSKFCSGCGTSINNTATKMVSEPSPKNKSPAIIIAAVLTLLSGILGLIFGILSLIGGVFLNIAAAANLAQPQTPFPIPNLNPLVAAIGGGAIVLGLILLVIAIVGIIAAYGLFKYKKYGAILGIILAVIGIIEGIMLFLFPLFGIVGILYNIVIIATIAVGWQSLN